jgi:glycosyltransferase involved in cell wall biosynthesis
VRGGTDTTPVISVIVPVYDVADYVIACLQSLQAQSFTGFEVLVVDDGSRDDSMVRARRTVAGDDRFRFLAQSNKGLSAARNLGLEHVRGDFIAFVDSDDQVAPEYLQKLYQTLQGTGADWVACGVRFVRSEGKTHTHSAIHGASKLADHPQPRRYSLDSWPDIVRHFPSAWNKLYRRSLITGLRFDVGTYYEDHAFYYRCACRTDHIEHLPEPLYLQTQGREGQITRDGSERVFEQLAVLDTLWDIIAASDKSDRHQGFQRIASRLSYERSTAISDPERRQRYLAACRVYLAGHGLVFDRADDPGIAYGWQSVMTGGIPVSVVIPNGGDRVALAATLGSLSAQKVPDFEVLLVQDGDAAPGLEDQVQELQGKIGEDNVRLISLSPEQGTAAARNRGLAAARGDYVVFLDAGDRLYPRALHIWSEALAAADADFGFSGFQFAGKSPEKTSHTGFHDKTGIEARLVAGPFEFQPGDALRLHAHPSAKIFRRAFLQAQEICFAPEPFSSWGVTMAAATHAGCAVYFTTPRVDISTRPQDRRLWRAPVSVPQIAAMLEQVGEVTDPGHLSSGWQARLFARALWEKLNHADFATPAAREAFVSAARTYAASCGFSAQGPLDPYIGPRIRHILGD